MKILPVSNRLVTLMAFCLAVVSCSEELIISTDTKPVPVVYCIMNIKDSVYKVVLSKTITGNQSAFEMAQDPDEIYYKNAQVYMEGLGSGYLIWRTDFHPTSATRDSGLFSSSAGFAYETKDVLTTYFGNSRIDSLMELGIEYLRLVIKIPDIEEPAYAMITPWLASPHITYPVYSYKVFNLCDTIPYYLEFYGSSSFYYDLRTKFRFTENTDSSQDRTINFGIKQNLKVASGKNRLEISPDLFFRQLASFFPNSSDNVVSRSFTSLDIELHVGSESFKTFIETYYVDNDKGYTLWNSFHGGIGLFALKQKTVLADLKMDQRTKDSLANGQYTKHLKFSKW